MNTETTLYQQAKLKASAEWVFRFLTEGELQTEVLEAYAEIEPVEGSNFTAWDGYINGTIIKLNVPYKINMLWKAEETEWPEEHYSVLNIDLSEVNGECLINLEQKEIPKGLKDNFEKGWKDYYWIPAEKWLSKQK